MPLYEYRCDDADCGHVFEALQRIADEPLDECRHCGGSARRIISTPAIQFMGTGWYVTDYARRGEAKKDGAKAGDKSEAKSETKPEKKPDSASSSASSSDASSKKPASGAASESRASSPP